MAQLGGMLGVVAADAEDLRGADGHGQNRHGASLQVRIRTFSTQDMSSRRRSRSQEDAMHCVLCGGATRVRLIQTDMTYQGERFMLVDIPAEVCEACDEPYF
ncbi:MAG: YgiT-type zinc finger protein, partial [Candidatus Sericytochromatia bacterium]